MRAICLIAYFLGILTGLASLLLLITLPRTPSGLAGGLISAAMLGASGVMAVAANVLYLLGLLARPFSAPVRGLVTVLWGAGHVVAYMLLPPLKGLASETVPPLLLSAGVAYVVLGLAMVVRG